MHPTELMWLFDALQPVKMYGSLTETDVEELYQEALANGE